MIDAGTTYTLLHILAMDALMEKIKTKMPSEMEAELRTLINGDWELCYMIKYRFVKVLLEIEFQFNGKGNSYPPSGENAWIDKSKGKFFLATERSDYDGSIFGLHQQIDVNVGIHLKHAEVSFAYDFDCP